MPRLTAVYIDYQCCGSERVWQWLGALGIRDQVELRPYSLDAGADAGAGPWDHEGPAIGLELLALGELAREDSPQMLTAYAEAVFRALHGPRADLHQPENWLALGSDLGLDLDAFTADTERWRAEVGLWHREAEDELGVFGTPTLVFDDAAAIFLELDGDVAAGGAQGLLDMLHGLLAHPVRQVRRTS